MSPHSQSVGREAFNSFGIRYIPRYFDPDIESGMPTLTAEGQRTVKEEMKDTTPPCMESSEVLRLSP